MANAISIIVVIMSTTLIGFISKLYLSIYSQEIFSSVSSIETTCWLFVGISYWIMYSCRSLVAQYSGNKDKLSSAKVVIQAIWISVPILIGYILCSVLAPLYFEHIFVNASQLQYFILIVPVGFLMCVSTIFASYFNGTGNFSITAIVLFSGCIVKVFLDPLLIFGWGLVPSLGFKGSVLSTALVYVLEIAIFVKLFLKINKKLISEKCRKILLFDNKIVKKIIKIGLPQATAHIILFAGWSTYHLLVSKVSDVNLFIVAICVSIFQLFSFISKSVGEGILIYCGYNLGAKNSRLSEEVFYRGLKIYGGVSLTVILIFITLMPKLLSLYLTNEQLIDNSLYQYVYSCVTLYLFFCFGEGIRTLYFNLFLSAADMKFLLYFMPGFFWLANVLPAVILVHNMDDVSLVMLHAIMVVYVFLSCIICHIRFRREHWKVINFIHSVQ